MFFKYIMDRPAWVLFFLHRDQIEWFNPIAKQIRESQDVKTVLWVIGKEEQVRGEMSSGYDEVVWLLSDFYPDRNEPSIQHARKQLRQFEEKYPKSRINQSAAISRELRPDWWSYNQIVQYAAQLSISMENEIDNRGFPIALIGENNGLHYRLAHGLVIEKSPHWFPLSPRHMLDRFYISDAQSERWPKCIEIYNRFRKDGIPDEFLGPAKELYEKLTVHHKGPYEDDENKDNNTLFSNLVNPVEVRDSLLAYFRQRRRGDVGVDLRVRPSSELHPLNRLKERLTKVKNERMFYKMSSNKLPSSRFAAYFLHVQPEYNVDGRAFPYRKQSTAIENMAAALPADMVLAVKEHSPMVGKRPPSYYEDLRQSPNVKIISDQVDGFELVQAAEIIFTLVGTVALEAMAYSTPAVIFSEVYFSEFEGIYKFNSLPDLPGLVKNILSGSNSGATKEAVLSAFAAMYSASKPGKFGDRYGLEQMHTSQNINVISQAFCEKIDSLSVEDKKS